MSSAFMGTKIHSVGGTLTVLNPQEQRTQKYICAQVCATGTLLHVHTSHTPTLLHSTYMQHTCTHIHTFEAVLINRKFRLKIAAHSYLGIIDPGGDGGDYRN